MFYNTETSDTLQKKEYNNLTPLTYGMFGYSLIRPTINQEFFDQIFDDLHKFGIPIEGWHTETGKCFDF